jgi:hypothetical protein
MRHAPESRASETRRERIGDAVRSCEPEPLVPPPVFRNGRTLPLSSSALLDDGSPDPRWNREREVGCTAPPESSVSPDGPWSRRRRSADGGNRRVQSGSRVRHDFQRKYCSFIRTRTRARPFRHCAQGIELLAPYADACTKRMTAESSVSEMGERAAFFAVLRELPRRAPSPTRGLAARFGSRTAMTSSRRESCSLQGLDPSHWLP